jgi:[glutamine synthetase] adenylyltransferase / [glutamine synthetase]-adenylyl-L-tyrosine phosphorylase
MRTDELSAFIKSSCPHLSNYLSGCDSRPANQLIEEILDSPNPRRTAGRIDDLLSQAPESTKGILVDNVAAPVLLDVLSGSGFLFSTLCRNNSLLARVFLSGGYFSRKTRSDKDRELKEKIALVTRTADLDKVLRMYKEEDYLRIGTRDLAGLAEVPEIMGELSDLAGACVQAAIDFHWQRLTRKHGLPPLKPYETGFVVIGMGKVSGAELNFSSDVDLIFLRGPREGRTSGPESIAVARFYDALALSVNRSLSDVTEDGFVFRVDLRLRPEGEKGELVPSMENALDYYLGWGRTWERAALMKAVPLAGDLGLGHAFIQELEPFIYRKYLDYSTLEEMRIMKLRIEAQIRTKPGINIKLGQGGIREIEFFVQTLQLINAGRYPRVRSASTLEALDLLRETGLLDETTATELREAYLFFRKTEHRIQINHQVQTHELPRTIEDQEELARRMGYGEDALNRFLSDLGARRRTVEEVFSGLFHHADEDFLGRISHAAGKIIESIHDRDATEALLSEAGFDEPASSYPLLKSIVSPAPASMRTEKSRNLLERLAPLFVDELLKVPEPGNALVALDSYIGSLQAHSAYFSTLLENPPTVSFIMKILGGSRFFTDLLIRHPQAIDSLISRAAVETKAKESLENLLSERIAYSEDVESALDTLRRFRNEEILFIGVRHLMGEIDSLTSRRLVTELAEVCLRAAVDIASKEMSRKFGFYDFMDSLPFVILGMGKLGGSEMTYLSDLDVIFIYDSPQDRIGRFSCHEWFSRLASRVISVLTVPTSEGTVWAIDTRLRPSGQKGPLVSSLASFRDYHATTSKVWEKQALIRARPVTGPNRLKEQVSDIIRDCITGTELFDEDVLEIARLRKRIEDELAQEDKLHVDLKTGHGGLVDVEFFVQANILKYAGRRPDVIRRNTLEALLALRDAEFVDAQSYQALDSGYRFLINLEDKLRIMEHRSIDRLVLAGEKLKSLAIRLGYSNSGESLVNDYFRITGSIRSIYNSFFHVKSDGYNLK